jgi:hypothetical protein
VPGFWTLSSESVTCLPPPPAADDPGPATAAPGDDYQYAPGCWVYQDNRYLWRPGFWVQLQQGWVWNPAHYAWAPCGYVFVQGYWDYPLERRGLLFAPIIVERRPPQWVYRPSYVVAQEALLSSLFVRPSFSHYYFGDFFDKEHRREGWVPWVDYRFARHGIDPLFSYYRFEHRREPLWEKDLRQVYVRREAGEVVRPPRTLVQQQRLAKEPAATKHKESIAPTRVLKPLGEAARATHRLHTITAQERAAHLREIERTRAFSQERRKVEQHEIKKAALLTRPGERPRTVKIAPAHHEAAPHHVATVHKEIKAPPAPHLPRHVERPHPKQEPPRAVVVPKHTRHEKKTHHEKK